MWDTWMLRDADRYHLFTLTQPYGKPAWDRVCHAVSSDWLHWDEWEEIPLEEEHDTDAWDAGVILTGTAFRAGDGYAMTYGAVRHGDHVQNIGVLFSDDLHVWEKCTANPVLCPAGPFYEAAPDRTAEDSVPWRDAQVLASEDGYEAFLCAADAAKPSTVNGCIARATSPDLVHWDLHAPIVSPGTYIDMEVPQYFEWNGRHYFVFSTSGVATRLDASGRERATGTYYLVADTKYGEYRAPHDNLLIGSGEGRFDAYVGKAIETDEGRLLYHHINGYRTAFAMPKVLRQDADGRLALERWPGFDQLLGRRALDAHTPGSIARAGGKVPVGAWRAGAGVMHADTDAAMSAWLFEPALQDFGCACEVGLARAGRAGIVFRVHEDKDQRDAGWAVSVDRARQRLELCRAVVNTRVALLLEPLDVIRGPVGDACRLEIFARASYFEIYCDGRPAFALNASPVTAADHPTAGRLGLFVEGGSASFAELEVREISEPLR